MRAFLIKLLFVLIPASGISQQLVPDSLRKIYFNTTNDSVLYEAAIHLYDYYEELNRDSAFYYAEQCVLISRRNGKKINEAHVLTRKAYQQLNLGRFAEALQSLLLSFDLSQNEKNQAHWDIGVLNGEKDKRLYALNCAHHIYGILMIETLNSEEAMIHFREAKRIAVTIESHARSLLASLNLGRLFYAKAKFDSALFHQNEALSIAIKYQRKKYLSTILYYTARSYMDNGESMRAVGIYYQAIESAIAQNNTDALTRSYHRLSEYYLSIKEKDSSLYYALKSLDAMKFMGSITQSEYNMGDAYEGLHSSYQLNGQFDSSYKYLALAQSAKDSIGQRRIKSLAEFQKLNLNEQQRLQNVERERIDYRNRMRTYALLSGIGILLLLAIIFFRNNRQKQKAKLKIEKAYNDLKAAQQQLIQSEKMASLGELTAGIAHEIQNPLNFVNNFSELNTELIDEMRQELANGNVEEAKIIATDIRDNEQKINHHGKRADSIVKGMLQHSRNNSGRKEPTDINALVDECLRLSYHGLRAKDKSFNARTEVDLDDSIPKPNIVSQDIGRVILNLFTNAFYAVMQKKKQLGDAFEPIVVVKTRNQNEAVEITVRDNGNGISQKIADKIFQPFFTTKPVGEGTGLGLSMSYDIITKGHGGVLKMRSQEGEFAEFIIVLPYNKTSSNEDSSSR